MNNSFLPSGVELDVPAPSEPQAADESSLPVKPGQTRLVQAVLRDQTDVFAELVQQNEWLLLGNEREISLQGNAFALENTLDGSGVVLLKVAPLPHARPIASDWDMRVHNGKRLELQRDDDYEWAEIPYQGGQWGRIAALHQWQRELRPFHPQRDGLLLTNTWGDRGRDAHLNPDFMAREIEAAARLGADVVQIDDGWQQGITQNSALAAQQGGTGGAGAWNGFWAADENFWAVNRTRFPDGLQPLIGQARALGLQFGLWFAPDCAHDAANWERDADALLKLHFELGIRFFKIDALKIESPTGEVNLRQLFAKVIRESKNAVTFDLDITAERRFGYFGLIEPGPLFVENRYTDWHRYWPHHTLRTLWQLSHWIDPLRLRMEWLNHARNRDKYQDDPLAPAAWQPDALFATVMMASPLGWFEVQNLPQTYFEQAAPLISTWKTHRATMAQNTTFPIGSAPDGASWTGFISLNAARDGGYALVFRELNAASTWAFEMPLMPKLSAPVEVLGGQGTARLEGGVLKVEVEAPLGFVWVRF